MCASPRLDCGRCCCPHRVEAQGPTRTRTSATSSRPSVPVSTSLMVACRQTKTSTCSMREPLLQGQLARATTCISTPSHVCVDWTIRYSSSSLPSTSRKRSQLAATNDDMIAETNDPQLVWERPEEGPAGHMEERVGEHTLRQTHKETIG